MENLKVLIDEKTLNKRVTELANQISNDYENEEIVLVCILKGAVYFATDLSRKMKNNKVLFDFMKIKSYGIGARESNGHIQLQYDICQDIENKNVIIVEDIVDSGFSLNYLYDYLKAKHPKTLKICVLLDKKERRIQPISIDYTGFVIEDKFVLGYGMDYDEQYRNLPYIGYIENE